MEPGDCHLRARVKRKIRKHVLKQPDSAEVLDDNTVQSLPHIGQHPMVQLLLQFLVLQERVDRQIEPFPQPVSKIDGLQQLLFSGIIRIGTCAEAVSADIDSIRPCHERRAQRLHGTCGRKKLGSGKTTVLILFFCRNFISAQQTYHSSDGQFLSSDGQSPPVQTPGHASRHTCPDPCLQYPAP